MKRIAVLTSGGDAPGMNAAIRAVVRTTLGNGMQAAGVEHGFSGLISGNITPLCSRDVSGIIQRGGTLLGSARCPEFHSEEGRLKAIRNLAKHDIDGVVVIGGNGSQTGAYELSQMGVPVAGVASTIDNDLFGSDITIGADTAINIALEAIDRLKVTASSHQRAFLVEVMGRKCGYPALMVGITGGAEAVVLPEVETDPEDVARELRSAYERGKAHALIVVAEGAKYNAEGLERYFREQHGRLGFELRVTILGHVQRGGTPTFADRLLGTRLGAAAVESLAGGNHGKLAGIIGGKVVFTGFADVVAGKKPLDEGLLALAPMLSK